MQSARYQIAGPDVTFEIFESEILIINLSNGSYHSLRGSAVQIWPALVSGHSPEEISALWPQQSGLSADLETFIDSLLKAELLVTRQDAAPASPLPAVENPPAYAAPLLESYTDMQDLLLLDPIHEVDVTGWPKQPDTPNQADN